MAKVDDQPISIVERAIRKALHSSEADTVKSFKIVYQKEFTRLVEEGKKRFHILFDVECPIQLRDGLSSLGSARITCPDDFENRYWKRAISDRDRLLADNGLGRSLSVTNSICWVSIQCYDGQSGIDSAYNSLAYVFGLIGIVSRRGTFLFSSNPHTPLSRFLIGPYATVHNASGGIASDFLADCGWCGTAAKSTYKSIEKKRIADDVNFLQSFVRRSYWRAECEAAILLCYDAGSQSQAYQCLLVYWKVLEKIGGPRKTDATKLIKRASAFFVDQEEMEIVGKHLLHRRNEYVHGRNHNFQDTEYLRHQVAELVRPILFAFLRNQYRFSTLDEFWDYCDAIALHRRLPKTMKVTRAALQFRSKFPG